MNAPKDLLEAIEQLRQCRERSLKARMAFVDTLNRLDQCINTVVAMQPDSEPEIERLRRLRK